LNKLIAKIIGIATLTGVLFLGAKVNIVAAADTMPLGGSSFETAVTLSAGTYTTDHEIAQDSYEFFKVSVAAGEALVIEMSTSVGGDPYAGVAVYDANRQGVGDDVIIGESSASRTVTWVCSYEDESTFYITIGNEYDVNVLGATYKVSVVKYYDADSQTDAGSTFDTALTLPDIGTYQGYLVSDQAGTDLKDLYRFHLAAGTPLTVTATPPSDESLCITIFNSMREELVSDSSANDGAILTVALPEPLATTDDLYIQVEAPYSYSTEVIGYTMKISTAEGAATDEGDTTTDGDAAGDEATTGGGTVGNSDKPAPNWTLIGGGVIGLVLAGVLLFTFLSKGKKEKPEEPSKPAVSAPVEAPEKEEESAA